MILWFLLNVLFARAQEPSQPTATAEIEVVASKDIEVFVAPIKIKNLSTDGKIEAVIDPDSAFTYTGSYAPHNTKTLNDRGIYVPLSVAGVEMMVYNERTIRYHWPDCNYKKDPLSCTVANSQYFMETIITIDDNQLVVRATLYDSDAQVVSSSTKTDDKIVRWIRQQETTVIQQQGFSGSQTITHKPKEELPLKWEIPHMLTDNLIREVMIGLWTGIRLK